MSIPAVSVSIFSYIICIQPVLYANNVAGSRGELLEILEDDTLVIAAPCFHFIDTAK